VPKQNRQGNYNQNIKYSTEQAKLERHVQLNLAVAAWGSDLANQNQEWDHCQTALNFEILSDDKLEVECVER
jgi:hypothetical protein